jgi:hypothetical protein
VDIRATPTALALVAAGVALATWPVGMYPPTVGLDASWNAGLAMATERGLAFGTEVIFSYGPLGFLQSPTIWFNDLGVLAFVYSSVLYLALCGALVWRLSRTLPLLLSALVAFVLLAVLPLLEQGLLLAVLASFALLEKERSNRVLNAFVLGASLLAALSALIKLSTGPAIVSIFLLALIGARVGRWRIVAFLALLFLELVLLWTLAGQSLANVPAFLESAWQIDSGYSTAMLREVDAAGWKVTAAVLAATAIGLGLVVVATRGRFRDCLARRCGVLLMAVAAFTVFKEAVVRTDAPHLSLFFSGACLLWIAIPWSGERRRWLLAGAAVILLAGLPVRPPGLPTRLDVPANLRFAGEQVQSLVSTSRREDLMAAGRAGMKAVYRLDRPTRAALRHHTVAIEPWEAGVAWAYHLDWEPLPVFQNYSAYTSALDAENARALEAPWGPERLLRENPLLVYPEFETADLDSRFAGWDPPAQARAALCHFAPVHQTERWELLQRVPNRCSAPRALGGVEATAGEEVPVPTPPPGDAVFARIEGVGVSGFERLGALVMHARTRWAIVNGDRRYRLIPETAGDGLLLRADPKIVEGAAAFSPFPQARTIEITGSGTDLHYEFYAMQVRSPGGSRPLARGPR